MICEPCAEDDHEGCDGSRHRTYCDCQHAPRKKAGREPDGG